MRHSFVDIERNIARCRVVLSVVAIVAVYVDPTRPTLAHWLGLQGGAFAIDPLALGVMGSHLAYSLLIYSALAHPIVSAERLAALATWVDVLYGAAIALMTEGVTSPFYAFFIFAVLAVGFRAGLRQTLRVTAVSVALYLSLIVVSAPENANFFIMRPVYLAITGYLVGYLGQQRINLEGRVRDLETAAERHAIARFLHDGYAQALAGVNLRLETCRELVRRGRGDEVFAELTDLQAGVNREYDGLRAYIRTLADVDHRAGTSRLGGATRFSVRACFDGPLVLVEHALQIMLEGARNVARHARAHAAVIDARAGSDHVHITIEDDGVGFPAEAPAPWSIASRVAELGGRVSIARDDEPGGHVAIELPA